MLLKIFRNRILRLSFRLRTDAMELVDHGFGEVAFIGREIEKFASVSDGFFMEEIR